MNVTEFVLQYEALGIRCFPVGLDKTPRFKWEVCRTEATGQRLARFQEAIDQGTPFLVAALPGEKYAVLDIDDLPAFSAYLAGTGEQLLEFSCPTVCTPSGGVHYWFSANGARDVRRFAWGETRSGDGGYVILPGGAEAVYEKRGRQIRGSYQWAVGVPSLLDWGNALPPLPEIFSRVERPEALSGNPPPDRKLDALPTVFVEGQRNDRLTSLAGSMQRKGMSPNAITAALTIENLARCSPPLSEKDVQTIARSVSRYAPAPPDILTRRTDSGNGEFFVHLYGDKVRYDHKRGYWLTWQKHWWQRDTSEEVYVLARQAARERQRQGIEITDEKVRGAVVDWGIGSESRQRLDNALRLARTMPPVADDGENWDREPWLLGVLNGIVDLRDGVLRDGKPSDRISKYAAVEYDPAALCPRWIQFCDEILSGDRDLIEFLQRYIGYCLTGDAREQCFLVLYGTGCNGKSVFLRTLRDVVLGDYAADMPFSTIELLGRSSVPNDLAALDGPRFVTACETTEGHRLNESRLKALTGCDCLTARHLYHEYFSFTPVAKFVLSVNHKPVVRDDSHAFWRRVRLVPFLRRFEGVNEDKSLAEKLAAEAVGILTWAVEGCRYWQQRGLDPPPSVMEATTEYERESDILLPFIEECCDFNPNGLTQAADLYARYVEWCDSRKLRDKDRLLNTAFGRRMSEKFEKTKGRIRFYAGITIRDRQDLLG